MHDFNFYLQPADLSTQARSNGGMAESSVHSWSRDEISSCSCAEKSYRHVHCPCLRCKGKATTRSTEMRHWLEDGLCVRHGSGTFDYDSESSDQSDMEPTIMDIEDEETGSEQPAIIIHGKEQEVISEPEVIDKDGPS